MKYTFFKASTERLFGLKDGELGDPGGIIDI